MYYFAKKAGRVKKSGKIAFSHFTKSATYWEKKVSMSRVTKFLKDNVSGHLVKKNRYSIYSSWARKMRRKLSTFFANNLWLQTCRPKVTSASHSTFIARCPGRFGYLVQRTVFAQYEFKATDPPWKKRPSGRYFSC